MMTNSAKTAGRVLLALVTALVLAAAAVWFVFPGLLWNAVLVQARHAAGLERKSIDVAGHHIVYLDGGNGTPIVLLHGFGARKDAWNALAARLTPHYRVIAPDLPGFGESPPVDGEKYDAPSQARRVHALLEALGVREHHIGGNSMGGLIATIYTATYPDGVRSLLISDAPGVRAPVMSELQRQIASGTNLLLARDEADVARLVDILFYSPPKVPAPIRRAIARDFVARRDTFLRIWNDLGLVSPGSEGLLEPLLPRISTPTLVLWGASDEMVDPTSADVFVNLLPDPHKVILPNCGHNPMVECPEPMARSYLAFLEPVPAAAQ